MNTIPKEALEQMRREGWPTKEEVLEYWRIHDAGGNIVPDRVEANKDRYNKEYFENWPSADQLSVMEQSYDQWGINDDYE